MGPGSHIFAVDVTLTDGHRLTTAVVATVSARAPGVPRQVLGHWTRTVTAAEVARTQNSRGPGGSGAPLSAGTWRVSIGADGVARYTDPTPAHELTVGQVRFEPGGRLVVGNQIPDFPHASKGGFCGDTAGDGIYQWSLHGNALTIQVVSDHQCANRNSFWNGTFTRCRSTLTPVGRCLARGFVMRNTGGPPVTTGRESRGRAPERIVSTCSLSGNLAETCSIGRGPGPLTGLGLAVLVMALAAACSSAAGDAGPTTQTTGHPAAASALDSQRTAYGSVVLDGSPGTSAVNARTGTLYVPIQCPDSFCSTDEPAHVVDVINAATCNAKVKSGCRVVARATVGGSPTAAVVDDKTGTVYVTNSKDGTVSVVNGARCNARVTSGCSVPRATIKLGGFLVAAAVNPATRTLYVADLKGGVFVVDAAACNAVTTRGCAQPAREVKDSQTPAGLDIDLATDTVYAVNNGDSDNGDTVSMINGATCNGTNDSGCGRAPATTKVGSGAFWAAVDQAHHSVYVANDNDGTVSVINSAVCNARVTSGCGQAWPTVTTGANPEFVALDPSSGTVFAVNHFDDTLSVIDTRTCNGTTTSGCAGRARNEQATPEQDPGFNSFPNAVTLIPQTGSAYVVNVGGRNVMSVVSVSHCNATDTTGCRTEAPSVPDHEATISADPATGTIYASNTSRPQIDVLNAATCHAGNLTGCAPVAEIPVGHPMASVSVVDAATHTLYAADPTAGTVAVINTATCNAATPLAAPSTRR